MKSYRDRYAEFAGTNATILAVSTDKESKQAKFRSTIGAPFAFIADAGAKLTKAYGVKMPLVKIAKRATFVIGKDRKVLHAQSGSSAINPDGAAESCSLW